MQFDKGYISPYFVTDAERMEAVLEDAYILLVQNKISSGRRPAAAAGEGRPGRQAAGHHRRGRRRRGAVDPGRQPDPRHLLVGRGQGSGLRRPAQGDPAGHRRPHRRARSSRPRSGSSSTRSASRCSAPRAASWSPRTPRPSSTAAATTRRVTDRVAQIQAEIENTDSDWDREKLQERLAKLAGGVVVIKVGAAHRGRAQGEQAPHRGRRLGDPRRDRGGHRRRRRHRPGARGGRARRRPRPRAATRPRASAIVRRAADEPLRWIAENAGERGLRRGRQGARHARRLGVQRRDGRVRRPGGPGCDRPGQGDPLGAAERGVDRGRCS